jgi:hypothetical protein
LGNGGGQLFPFPFFDFELLPAVLCKFVVFRPAIIFRCAPACLDPAAAFETMQRGIQRTLLNQKYLTRNLVDALGNGPSVHRLEKQSAQDQEIERALRKIDGLFGHVLPFRFYRKITLLLSKHKGTFRLPGAKPGAILEVVLPKAA